MGIKYSANCYIFLLDSTNPGVMLSTSSPSISKESNINVMVEFTKPVFRFEASMVKVAGGTLTRQVQMVTQNYIYIYITIVVVTFMFY